MRLRKLRFWRRSEGAAAPPEGRVLLRAIQQLPPEFRDVFVLHRYAGMSLEQIAEHLGIGQEEVEARLAEALFQLCRVVDEAALT